MAKMLTKEEFVEIIEFMKEKNEAWLEINEVANRHKKVWDDFGPDLPMDRSDTFLISLMERLLDIPCDDKYGSTLSWWIYDMEFGTKFKQGDFRYTDRKTGKETEPDLSTAELLYDELLKEHEENAQDDGCTEDEYESQSRAFWQNITAFGDKKINGNVDILYPKVRKQLEKDLQSGEDFYTFSHAFDDDKQIMYIDAIGDTITVKVCESGKELRELLAEFEDPEIRLTREQKDEVLTVCDSLKTQVVEEEKMQRNSSLADIMALAYTLANRCRTRLDMTRESVRTAVKRAQKEATATNHPDSEWRQLKENGTLLSYLEEEVDRVPGDTLEGIATKFCLVTNCNNCPVTLHNADTRTEEEKAAFATCQDQLLIWMIKEAKKRDS